MKQRLLSLVHKDPGVKEKLKITTQFIHRRGDQILPVWKPNVIGSTVEKMFGVGLRFMPFGTYVSVLETHNLITNVGHKVANGRMSNQGSFGVVTTLAIGIGTTAATISDTALATEQTTSGAARAAATASQVTTNVSNDTTQLLLTFTFTTAFAISEEGIFDTTTAPASGNLVAKQVFATINVSSGDSLTVKHQYVT